MNIKHLPLPRLGPRIAMLGAASLTAAVFAGSGIAQGGQSFPIFPNNGYTSQVFGTVQFAGPGGAPNMLRVELHNVAPYEVFTAGECQVSTVTFAETCVWSSDSVNIDAAGNGVGMLAFDGLSEVDAVRLGDSWGDSFVALTDAGAGAAVFGSAYSTHRH